MITIYKNPNGDTRTAPKDVSKKEFRKANYMHREDVFYVLKMLSKEIKDRGYTHDYTKVTKEREFYRDFLSTMNEGTNFVESEWYQYHINTERHHLLSCCPDDVNLIDVLEMIADCVCAGLTRSGEIRDLEIDDDILRRAVQNTVKMIADQIEVVEKEVDIL